MEGFKTRILEALKTKQVNVGSAIEVLTFLMQEADKLRSLSGEEKKALVLSVLTEVAKGEDGKEGTSDDVVSPEIVKGIKAIVDNNLVPSLINVIVDASKGKLELNQVQTCTTNFTTCLFSMLQSAKK